MSTPAMGKVWIETVYLQTGIKADVKQFSGRAAASRADGTAKRSSTSSDSRDMVTGECKDAFAQVMNQGSRAGCCRSIRLSGDEQAVQGLSAAKVLVSWRKGRRGRTSARRWVAVAWRS
jgi:hypothetical protein